MFSIKNKCKYSIHELHNHYFDPDSIWILIGLCFVVKREIIEFPKKPPAPKKTPSEKTPQGQTPLGGKPHAVQTPGETPSRKTPEILNQNGPLSLTVTLTVIPPTNQTMNVLILSIPRAKFSSAFGLVELCTEVEFRSAFDLLAKPSGFLQGFGHSHTPENTAHFFYVDNTKKRRSAYTRRESSAAMFRDPETA